MRFLSPTPSVRCARPACRKLLTRDQIRTGCRACSKQCSARLQFGENPGQSIAIAPGDRWEKIAPQMTYTQSVRLAEIRELYAQETFGRYPYK